MLGVDWANIAASCTNLAVDGAKVGVDRTNIVVDCAPIAGDRADRGAEWMLAVVCSRLGVDFHIKSLLS